MRRLKTAVCLAALALLALGPGCKRKQPKIQTQEEETQELATIVHVADPRSAVQLVKGFHEVEQGAWRWTKGAFAVTLRPPRGAAQRGANLVLRFALPDAVIEKLKTVEVSAKVGGTQLKPETYSVSGEHVYSREVPGTLLAGEGVLAEFAVDKTYPPSASDPRELGLIVTTIGFEAK